MPTTIAPNPGRAAAACLALCLAAAGAGRAQSAPPSPLAALAPAVPAPAVKLDPVEVTGSRIKRTDTEGPSPVLTITRPELELAATNHLSEILREVPEVGPMTINESNTTTFARGTSALDLRGLGASNTLVLLDGRRQSPYGISFAGVTFVDLNRYPTAMIERVEILKDGASAVYGADAIAGVVNLITRRNFSGAEISARYGNYGRTDGAEQSYAFVGGLAQGRLRATVSLTQTSRRAIAATDVPISVTADQTEYFRRRDPVKYAEQLLPTAGANSFFDSRSAAGPYATISVPTPAQLAAPRNALTLAAITNPLTGQRATALPGTGGVPAGTLGTAAVPASVPLTGNTGRPAPADFVPRSFAPGPISNLYDFQPFVWLQPETMRRGLATHVDFDVADFATLYADVSFMRIRSRTQLAPAPTGTTFPDNAILVPASNYYNPFGIPVAFTFRPLEVGPRIALLASDSLNAVAGVRGTVADRFDWDVGASFSKTESTDTTENAVSETRLRAALAKSTPDAFNVFGGPGFKNDPATIDSVRIVNVSSGNADTMTLDVRVTTAELFALPWGAVGSAVAVEHRRERFNVTNDDFATVLDDLVGSSRAPDATSARRTVDSVAAELRVPLVREGRHRWLHTAELSGAARFETFSEGYDSGVKPSVGLRLRPTRDLLLRATHGEVFRAPTLPQLYGGVLDNTFTGAADLRRPPALTGDPADATTAPRLLRQGGNPDLKPEQGTTEQVGAVFDVPWRPLRGLSLEVTHGRIRQRDVIRTSLGTTFILQNELGATADLIVREPGSTTVRNDTAAPISVLTGAANATTAVAPGQTATVPGRIVMILDAAANLSTQIVRYWDFGARYRFAAPALGRFAVSTSWTLYDVHSFRRDPAAALIPTVGRGLPRYRGQSSVTWQRGPWAANAGMAYTHRYRDYTIGRYEVPRYYTYSAGLSYGFARTSWLGETRLSLGIDNLLDREPPVDGSGGANPTLVARPAGRFAFVALKRSL